MLTQAQLESLLNRPLTASEVTNLALYLDIANSQLSQLLCFTPEKATGTATARLYETREGYRTIFTAPFVGTPVVSIDGAVQASDTYTVRQFDNLNGTWFNSIVFKSFIYRDVDTVTITADWGFTALPNDLSIVLANVFNMQSSNSSGSGRVKSKKIEDFSITYSDVDEQQDFDNKYSGTIAKYSLCSQSNIRHGNVCYPYWRG